MNAKMTFATWGSLPATPFRVLVFMALTSLDETNGTTPARRYFAGRETLAVALGREVPQEPEEDDQSIAAVSARRVRHAAFVAVQTALTKLKAMGAITPIRKGSHGHQAEYELNLDPFPKQGEPVASNRVSLSEKQGEPVCRDRVSLSPRNHLGTTEDLGGGRPQLGSSSHQGAAVLAPDDDVDTYLVATKTLEQAGSDRAERLMAQVWADHPEATTRELVMLSADLARGATKPVAELVQQVRNAMPNIPRKG